MTDQTSYSALYCEKVRAAIKGQHPVILSWEFAQGLQRELETVADWVREKAQHDCDRTCGHEPLPTGDRSDG